VPSTPSPEKKKKKKGTGTGIGVGKGRGQRHCTICKLPAHYAKTCGVAPRDKSHSPSKRQRINHHIVADAEAEHDAAAAPIDPVAVAELHAVISASQPLPASRNPLKRKSDALALATGRSLRDATAAPALLGSRGTPRRLSSTQ